MPNQRRPDFQPAKTSNPSLKKGGSVRHPNSLANLIKYKPGESGNPSGKSSSINEIMRLARSHCVEAVERLVEIMRDRSGNVPPRETITACMAIMDRGMGRPVVPVFRGTPNGFPSEMISDLGADGAETALIAAAKGAGETYKRTLESELERLKNEEQQAKAKSRAETDAAALAMQRGDEVEPALRILASVRNETD